MKTVVIYDSCGEEELKFFVVNGDWRRFNRIYMNSTLCDKALQDELDTKLFTPEGNFRGTMTTKFPTEAVKEGAAVIVCGFIP